MCGIAGYIGDIDINPLQKSKVLQSLIQRGPDYQSCKIYKNRLPKKKIYFFHTRLNIIDLEQRSNQPYEDENYSIIFNGEIYNYIEIKADLKKKNIIFKTKSDTEVLLKSYILYGKSCFKMFEGMWSLAIFDKNKKKIILSRDRFGEKPLYYLHDTNNFFFSSDIKAIKILKNKDFLIDKKKLISDVINGYRSIYKDPSKTIFKNIFSLEPSFIMEFDLNNGSTKKFKYYKPSINEFKFQSRLEFIEYSRGLLFDNIKKRLRSDVSTAFNLSGGVDSSSLVSIAYKKFNHKINSFSIIDDKNSLYNESANINKVVKECNANHTEIRLSEIYNKPEYVLQQLYKLIEYKSSPLPTITSLLQSFLYEKISHSNHKVAYSGSGADEMYSGYIYHMKFLVSNISNSEKILKNYNKYWKPFIRNKLLKSSKNFSLGEFIYDGSKKFKNLLNKKYLNEIDDFNQKIYFKNSEFKNRLLNELFHEIVPVLTREEDQNAMYYSVENRSPFLDHKILDLNLSVPISYFERNGYLKSILRDSVKGILPDKVRLDRQKKGFNSSFLSLFDFNKVYIKSIFEQKNEVYEYFDKKKVIEFINNSKFDNTDSKFIFSLLNLIIFLE